MAQHTNGPTEGANNESDAATPPWSPAGYLDAGSGLPMHPRARDALLAAYADGWADPDRIYRDARRARLLLDNAREQIAAVLGARPDEISFTGSGIAAAHLAILGTARGRNRVGSKCLVSAVEHSAILAAAAFAGHRVELPVDALGRLELSAVESELTRDTALIAVQSANQEVGTTQPLAAVGTVAKSYDVPLVVDASASLGRLPIPTDWDCLVGDARLWGGGSGVGVLAVRTGVRWRSPMPDDGHEFGRVPGMPAIAAIVAAAVGLEAVEHHRVHESTRLAALIDHIRQAVAATVPDTVVLGDPVDRLPHIVTFSCLYVEGQMLLSELDRAGIAVTSGSACVADSLVPSHVLAAMGALTHGNIRVSLPFGCQVQDVERFLRVLPEAVARVRSELGAERL